MVEVKMKTISAGPDGAYGVGDKRMVSEDEAKMLVPDYAEFTVLPVPLPAQQAQEKAVISPAEVAVKVAPPVEDKPAEKTAPWGKN